MSCFKEGLVIFADLPREMNYEINSFLVAQLKHEEEINKRTEFCDWASGKFAYLITHVSQLKTNPEIEEIKENIKREDLNFGDCVVYLINTVFHMGIIIENEGKQFLHNWPGQDVTFWELSKIPNIVNVIIFKEDYIKPGYDERLINYQNNYGNYNSLSNNCEHFVNYIITGNHQSFTKARIVRKTLNALITANQVKLGGSLIQQ